ncbi:hypothetical protein Pla175_03240 [Pirellulimonas nuda]|uniref:J domain-containing protein n=1 Tax=Pirellulimonas nuda TaxID=2528009 RepID=A0A518D671_9BACT|nr:J domain-containing protein [Pirellulimonas nuda]QDU86970.1 hypothetical protein Pla175_03240 [Pirellulimonas nuda]
MSDPPEHPDAGDEPEPEWSRLPHDAVGFFALTEPIDRKELKRAYNRLIRRYKPERAPAEFQRIRAAYEQLDERLRYGESVTPAPRQKVVWEETPPEEPVPERVVRPIGSARPEPRGPDPVASPLNSPAPAPDPQPDTPPSHSPPTRPKPTPKRPAPLTQRLTTEPPGELYAQLMQKQHKSPFDYYALAVLADVVERKAPLKFAEWLLAGVRAHPGDGALARLLHEYVRGPLPDGAAEKLLPAVARVVRNDGFYALTEPLWRSLLRETSVDEFAGLLAACERELHDTQIVGRMVFYVQLAGGALLMGEHPWPLQAIDYVERNFEQIPPWMEQDVDMLGVLREYAAVRARFVQGHPLRAQIDAALRDYFTQDQQAGDRSVVACQVAIASDLDGLAAAFPLEENELYEAFYPIWAFVSWDVGERHAPPVEQESPAPDWSGRVVELVRLLGRQGMDSVTELKWGTVGCLTGLLATVITAAVVGVVYLVLAAVVRLIYSQPPDWLFIAFIIACIVGPAALWLVVKHKLNPRIRDPYREKIAKRMFRDVWRPGVLRFLQRSHLDDHIFRTLLGKTPADIPMAAEIYRFVQQDYAVPMLVTAQRFLA